MRYVLAALAALTSAMFGALPVVAQSMEPRAYLPVGYSHPIPTATPRPAPTATPKAGAPWRPEWRRRTPDEVIDQFVRDGLPAEVVARETHNEAGVHCDMVGVRTVGRRPRPAADFIVVDCYDRFSRTMFLLAFEEEPDIDGAYHRNIVYLWPVDDPPPNAYIRSYLDECATDPYCDPDDGAFASAGAYAAGAVPSSSGHPGGSGADASSRPPASR